MKRVIKGGVAKATNAELDEKLREAIRYVANEDGYAEEEDLDIAVAKIKQIYADEVTPKVDVLVQDMVNLHTNMKYDMIRLGMTPTPKPIKQKQGLTMNKLNKGGVR